jgi:hypothetical protein
MLNTGSKYHNLLMFLNPFFDIINIDSNSTLTIAYNFQTMIVYEISHSPVVTLSQGCNRLFNGKKSLLGITNMANHDIYLIRVSAE